MELLALTVIRSATADRPAKHATKRQENVSLVANVVLLDLAAKSVSSLVLHKLAFAACAETVARYCWRTGVVSSLYPYWSGNSQLLALHTVLKCGIFYC